uniref:Uncharacterized protein n=1 Tax=Nothobranchius furzeri TaxID=105023 RepID=A0A1A8U8A2_NOTFU
MLEDPFPSDVLFGPHLRSAIERAQKTAALPAPRSRPPASAPHQRDQRDGGQRFRRGQQTPSWQSQVHEPRRKQPRK